MGGRLANLLGFAAVDSSGNVYVTGATASLNHPTTADGNDRILGGSFDGYLTVLDANGASLVYSTYLGGGVNNRGYDVTLDSNGTAYVTGFSESNETWGSTAPTTPFLDRLCSATMAFSRAVMTVNSRMF